MEASAPTMPCEAHPTTIIVFGASNLRYMRSFYQAIRIRDALRHESSWTGGFAAPMSPSPPTVAIVGLGYVGLPPAATLDRKFRTIGYDLSEEKVAACRRHADPTGEVYPEDLRAAGGLDCTTDSRRLAETDFVKEEKQELAEIFHQFLPTGRQCIHDKLSRLEGCCPLLTENCP